MARSFRAADLEGVRVVSVRLAETGENYDAAEYVREKEARDAATRERYAVEQAKRDLAAAQATVAKLTAQMGRR
jgi:hypothetical protein